MKSWSAASLIIIILAGILYGIVWFVAIPAAAKALQPFKWRSIVLQQERDDYRLYLGEPLKSDSSFTAKADDWIVKRGDYEFHLNIKYNSDTIASAWSVEYHFSNFFFSKTETLAARPAQE